MSGLRPLFQHRAPVVPVALLGAGSAAEASQAGACSKNHEFHQAFPSSERPRSRGWALRAVPGRLLLASALLPPARHSQGPGASLPRASPPAEGWQVPASPVRRAHLDCLIIRMKREVTCTDVPPVIIPDPVLITQERLPTHASLREQMPIARGREASVSLTGPGVKRRMEMTSLAWAGRCEKDTACLSWLEFDQVGDTIEGIGPRHKYSFVHSTLVNYGARLVRASPVR